MSAPIGKNQLAFQLPNLSYIDVSLEEPSLRVAPPAPRSRARRQNLFVRLSRGIKAWRTRHEAVAEMETMSDRELLDIGLTRADIPRVFDPRYNMDLRNRGV
jgi:uncharacterized protein YjiS (DUF1127 family)